MVKGETITCRTYYKGVNILPLCDRNQMAGNPPSPEMCIEFINYYSFRLADIKVFIVYVHSYHHTGPPPSKMCEAPILSREL